MPDTPDPRFRAAAAAAVHDAVCQVAGGDGYGHCLLYAHAGAALLGSLLDAPYQIQIGSLAYRIDPAGGGWLELRAEDGGLDRGEYHAWVGLAGAPAGPANRCEIAALVDFSTRHLRAMAERMPRVRRVQAVGACQIVELGESADPVEWTRPDGPPEFVWAADGAGLPDDFRYVPDAAAIVQHYGEAMLPDSPWRDRIRELRNAALHRFAEIING